MKFMARACQQALTNILRNKAVNFLCLGIIAFTLLVPGLKVIPVPSLTALVNHLSGVVPISPAAAVVQDGAGEGEGAPDFREIKGQEHVKRALEVAAAGGHNLLMTGPPGAGKTLLARALPSILPDMTIDEALDVTRVYSIADQLPPDVPLVRSRPFRSTTAVWRIR